MALCGSKASAADNAQYSVPSSWPRARGRARLRTPYPEQSGRPSFGHTPYPGLSAPPQDGHTPYPILTPYPHTPYPMKYPTYTPHTPYPIPHTQRHTPILQYSIPYFIVGHIASCTTKMSLFFARLPQAKAVLAARRLHICAPQARKNSAEGLSCPYARLHLHTPWSTIRHAWGPRMGPRQLSAGARAGAAVEALPAAGPAGGPPEACCSPQALLAAGAARRRRRRINVL